MNYQENLDYSAELYLDKSNKVKIFFPPIYLYLIYLFLFTIFFILDLKIPLGVATGVPYIVPILFTVFSEKASHTYIVSTLGAILTILGYYFSPTAGAISWMVIVNRFLALFIISVTCYFVLHRKTSEKKIIVLNERLRKLANTDILTNIANRLLFNKVLNEEVRRSIRYNNPLSIIVFDIDFFKKINDSFGHDVGDKVLIELAKLVNKKIRKTDYFFRIGGEEFAILLTETELENAKNVAEIIRKMIEDSDKQNMLNMKSLTISLGVTSFQKNDSKESFFKRADVAMYNSKNNGRNQVSTF